MIIASSVAWVDSLFLAAIAPFACSVDPPRRVPHGVTLIGRLFDEGTIARAVLALERALNVVEERPPDF